MSIDLPAMRRRVIEELRKEWPEGNEVIAMAQLASDRQALKAYEEMNALGVRDLPHLEHVNAAMDFACAAVEIAHAVGSDAWSWLPAVVEDARREVDGNS